MINDKSFIVVAKSSKNQKEIPLTYDTWDQNEINAINKTIASNQLTQSNKVQKLEKIVANYHKRKFCLMVNSGSSANLIGVAAMKLQTELNLNDGDEFIAPGIGWSTSYSPFIQNNLNIKFVDVNKMSFNIDTDLIEKNINYKTKGILTINILGNPCEYEKILKISKKYKLILVEDNCESLGAIYNKKKCGSFGLWSSLSSYYSHHISTIEGGFFLTDNKKLFSIAKSIRSHGWIRGQENNKIFKVKRFSNEKRKFLFYYPGYNLRSTELNAAVGLEQFKKIDMFVRIRRKNYKELKKIISKYRKITIQKECKFSSWFGFGFTFYTTKKKMKKILEIFKKNKIETRPIVTGDFTSQPVMKYYSKNDVKYKLPNCSYINDFGIMIGNSHINLTLKQKENLIITFKSIDRIIEK